MIHYSVQQFLEVVKMQGFTHVDICIYPSLVPCNTINCDTGKDNRTQQVEKLINELKVWFEHPAHQGRFKVSGKPTHNHPAEYTKEFIVDKMAETATGMMQGTTAVAITEAEVRAKIIQEETLKDLSERVKKKDDASEMFAQGLYRVFEIFAQKKGVSFTPTKALQGVVVSDPAHPSQQPNQNQNQAPMTDKKFKDEESKWEYGAELLAKHLNGDEFVKFAEAINSDPNIIKMLKSYIG